MNSCDLFQTLAAATWHRVGNGYRLRVRQGEEGISDWLLLDIAGAGLKDVEVAKTAKDLEPTQGTDWEWWIGNHKAGWLRYAVQAKAVDVPSGRYDTLAHKVSGTPQIDILETWARRTRSIPIYCLYSHVLGSPARSPHLPALPVWALEQFGCSITPARHVRTALGIRGARSFSWFYQRGYLFPWRCLVCCPAFAVSAASQNPVREGPDDIPFIHHTLPAYVSQLLASRGNLGPDVVLPLVDGVSPPNRVAVFTRDEA